MTEMTEDTGAEDPSVLHEKGISLRDGKDGCKQDWLEASRYFLQAAYRNHRPSQIAIAGMYEYGRGVPKSPTHAWAWITIACVCRNEEEEKELQTEIKEGEDSDSVLAKAEEWRIFIKRRLNATSSAYATVGQNGSGFTEATKLSMKIYHQIHKWDIFPGAKFGTAA